jgi:hypothetical protein
MAMSYTISGENNGLDYSQLRKLFKECSNTANGNQIIWEEKLVTKNVHISFGTFGNFINNGKLLKSWSYDPLFFKQNSTIKNTLGDHNSLINKSQLYSTTKKDAKSEKFEYFLASMCLQCGISNSTIYMCKLYCYCYKQCQLDNLIYHKSI